MDEITQENLSKERIRFSHSIISSTFTDGRKVATSISAEQLETIPPLLVCKFSDEELTSLNNRRLFMFHHNKSINQVPICKVKAESSMAAVNSLAESFKFHSRICNEFALGYVVDDGLVMITFTSQTLKHEVENVCARQPCDNFPLVGSNVKPNFYKKGGGFSSLYLKNGDIYRKSPGEIESELVSKKNSIFVGWNRYTREGNNYNFKGIRKSFSDDYSSWLGGILTEGNPPRQYSVKFFRNVYAKVKDKSEVKVNLEDDSVTKLLTFSIDANAKIEKRKQFFSTMKSKPKNNTLDMVDAFVQTNSIDFDDEWFMEMMDTSFDMYFAGIYPPSDGYPLLDTTLPITYSVDFESVKEASYFKITNHTIFGFMMEDIKNYDNLINKDEDYLTSEDNFSISSDDIPDIDETANGMKILKDLHLLKLEAKKETSKSSSTQRKEWRIDESLINLSELNIAGIHDENTLVLLARLEVTLTVSYEALEFALTSRKQVLESILPDEIRQNYFTSIHYVFQGAVLAYSKCFEFSKPNPKNSFVDPVYTALGYSFVQWWTQGEWLPDNDNNLRELHRGIIGNIRNKGIRHFGSNWAFLVLFVNNAKKLQRLTIEMAHGGANFDEIANIIHNFTALALISIRRLITFVLSRKNQILPSIKSEFELKCHSSENRMGLVNLRVGLGNGLSMMPEELKLTKPYVYKEQKVIIQFDNVGKKLSCICLNTFKELTPLEEPILSTCTKLVAENKKDICYDFKIMMHGGTQLAKLIEVIKLGIDVKNFPSPNDKIIYYSWISAICSNAKVYWEEAFKKATKRGYQLDPFPKKLAEIANNAAHNATRSSNGLQNLIFLVEAAISKTGDKHFVHGQIVDWDIEKMTELANQLKIYIEGFLEKLSICAAKLEDMLEISDEDKVFQYEVSICSI